MHLAAFTGLTNLTKEIQFSSAKVFAVIFLQLKFGDSEKFGKTMNKKEDSFLAHRMNEIKPL